MQANNNEQAAAVDDDNNELPQCMICYTDLKHPCVTPCGHDEICGTCHLRLRHLHSDKKCPLCKQENAQLIVDTYSDIKPFEEYPLWGNELGSDFSYREDVGMFFPSEHYEQEVLPLFGYHCGQCNQYDGVTPEANMYEEKNPNQQQKQRRGKQQQQPKTPLRLLQDHLRNKHRTTLCSLCVDFKRDFVSRLPRFSPAQLKHHLQTGDGDDSGFRGHPVCEFCRPKRFYDLTNLHMHLQKDHYKCHVCDKAGLANQYFRDYNALERHFDKQHFLCQDVQCLAARFMVFDNEIDLRAHEVSVHGTGGGDAKIQVEFRVRREGYSGAGYENQTVPSGDDFQYGLDGQAFVPEALPAVALDEATSHPQHFRRTAELRAQAAEIRATQEAEEYNPQEAFPSLGSENNNNNLRMGWTANSGTLQRITKKKTDSNSREQFPSLPSSSSGGRKSVAAKLRNSGGGNRQFSAMRQAAMGSAPAPTSNNWSGASSVPRTSAPAAPFMSATGGGGNRQSNLQSDNFPSLGGATKTRTAYPSMSSAYGGGGATSTNRSTTPPNLSSGNNFPSLGGAAPKMSNNNFPSLGGASKTRATYPVNNHMKHSQSAPSLHNAAHFPPPPAAARNNNSVRQKLLGQKPAAPANNMANFPAPPPSSLQQGMATVGEMKASLGTNKYKELKNLTKEFATDSSLAPHAYVDHAAALFDGGYGDADFWGFVPGLLLSCPNQTSAAAALRYMDDLKRASSTTNTTRSATAPSWSASSAVVAPPPARAAAAAAAAKPAGGYYYSATSSSASRAATRVAKHQANSWGAGGAASSVTRAKAAPASVAVAAASQGPQGVGGNATSYKEKKQPQNANNNNNGGGKKKKNKNKKNNDLRALAFGK